MVGRVRRRDPARAASLTGQDGSRAVLLGVAVLQADGASAGLCLVGTQPLPLLLQPVLVLQVILHVGLGEERGAGFSSRFVHSGVNRQGLPVSEVPRGRLQNWISSPSSDKPTGRSVIITADSHQTVCWCPH